MSSRYERCSILQGNIRQTCTFSTRIMPLTAALIDSKTSLLPFWMFNLNATRCELVTHGVPVKIAEIEALMQG